MASRMAHPKEWVNGRTFGDEQEGARANEGVRSREARGVDTQRSRGANSAELSPMSPRLQAATSGGRESVRADLRSRSRVSGAEFDFANSIKKAPIVEDNYRSHPDEQKHS